MKYHEMSPWYECNNCDENIGYKFNRVCLYCQRIEVCKSIKKMQFIRTYHTILSLPEDIIEVIADHFVDNNKYTKSMFICAWKTVNHSKIYKPDINYSLD